MPFMATQANTSCMNNLLSLTVTYINKPSIFMVQLMILEHLSPSHMPLKIQSSKPDAIMQVQCGPQTYCSQFLSSN